MDKDRVELAKRLERIAKGNRELAAEWSSREIGDKYDDEAAKSLTEDAVWIEQAAASLRLAETELPSLKSQVLDYAKMIGGFNRQVRDLEARLTLAEAVSVGLRESLAKANSTLRTWVDYCGVPHDGDCLEDDTCGCEIAAQINDAVRESDTALASPSVLSREISERMEKLEHLKDAVEATLCIETPKEVRDALAALSPVVEVEQ